jgi:hypothetical protein
MNLTRQKLFVRRNVKTKAKVCRYVKSKYDRSINTFAQTNENIFTSVMNGKTSYDKLFEINSAETLHKHLKPLLIFLRLLGCFPAHFSKSGEYKHSYTQMYDHTFKIPISMIFWHEVVLIYKAVLLEFSFYELKFSRQ